MDKSVEPYQKTNGFVLDCMDEEDALDCGLILSIVIGDADIVPGIESKFCDTSKSTSMGDLPSFTAEENTSFFLRKSIIYKYVNLQ